MALIGAFIIFMCVAVLEALAFIGVRLSLDAERHRRRAQVIALLYGLLSAVLLGAVVASALFGSRNADNEPQLPHVVVIAAMAVYPPKIVIAVLAALELVRRAATGLARRALAIPAAALPGWLTRTRLLPRIGVIAATLMCATTLWYAILGSGAVKVYRHEVLSQSLPAEFDGLRIVHISDIHASSLGSDATLLADRLVAAVNAEEPDLVLFTGDYGQPEDFDRGPDILGRLRARLGKFAVLGNHDFGSRERATDNWTSVADKRRKIDALARAFRLQGFTLLVNDAAVLSRDSAALTILGVGVYEPHHGFDDADYSAVELSAATARFRILMAHSPQYWEDCLQGRRPIDLTLVGHTHGGQIGVGIGSRVWSLAALQVRHSAGLYRDGRQYLNVNRGAGYVGLPFRLNMPADVSLIVVRSKRE